MTSSELRDYATVIAATVTVLVFVMNSLSMMRNPRVENLARFNETHQWLFGERGYIGRNLAAIESGRSIAIAAPSARGSGAEAEGMTR